MLNSFWPSLDFIHGLVTLYASVIWIVDITVERMY